MQAPPEGGPDLLAHWWSVFDDPTLTLLIDSSLDGNLDLRMASSRLRQARAALGANKSDLLPTLDASTTASQIPVLTSSTKKGVQGGPTLLE